MAKVFFNPLNYWLILTAVLVIADKITADKLYFLLAGVAAFAAAFSASVSLGLAWQVGAFVVVGAVLLKFAHEPLKRMRENTMEGIEEAIAWYRDKKGVVVTETCSTRRGSVVLEETFVFPALSKRRLTPGAKITVSSVQSGVVWVEEDEAG